MMLIRHLPPSEDIAPTVVNTFEKRAEEAIHTMRRFLREPPSILKNTGAYHTHHCLPHGRQAEPVMVTVPPSPLIGSELRT